MLTALIHLSRRCHTHNLPRISRLIDKIVILLFKADIPGRADIHPRVSFSHGGIGVIINPAAKIGEGCIIGAKVTLGNAFPHGGAPTLGRHVYVGVGAFLGGGIQVPDYVIVGANSVLTKDVPEPGVIVAGNPARVLRKLTPQEIQQLNW